MIDEELLAAAAARSKGAVVLAIFASLWLMGGASLLAHDEAISVTQVVAVHLLLLAASGGAVTLATKSAKRLACHARPWTEAVRRWFWIINGAQYAALSLLGSWAGSGGSQRWLVPVGLAIVGAHFLPLAILFRSKQHAIIGLSLLLVALVIGTLVSEPFAPVGVLAGGAALMAGSVLLSWTARVRAAAARLAG